MSEIPIRWPSAAVETQLAADLLAEAPTAPTAVAEAFLIPLTAYLRATLPVMESLARAERLRELQARNAERAAAAGQDYESLLAEIRQAYKGGTRER